MNEFIEQFLVEARELVDQATNDLLALESRPGDPGPLDSAFRAFHTLKGAAGIVEFEAMARLLHAAEEVLSRVRSGDRVMTPQLVGDSLACLDQVAQWLDAMQVSGDAPTDASLTAEAMMARFAKPDPLQSAAAAATAGTGWVGPLLARHADVRPAARTAIRYAPDSDAFLRGEDPMALIEAVLGLLAIDLGADGLWPALEEFDAFQCRLIIEALSEADSEAVSGGLGNLGGEISVAPLALHGMAAKARSILEEQRLLLQVSPDDAEAGRRFSAARTAANLLRYTGDDDGAARLEAAAASGRASLLGALEAVLAGRVVNESADYADPSPGDPMATLDVGPRTLRVDAERVDALVRLTGELTVAKNALGHLSALAQSGAETLSLAAGIKEQHAVLERLTEGLQRAALSLRVLPLRHVFQRFPRLVRDMGVALDKPIRLAIEGEDTEADKAVVEALFEPLLHVLRNAADHGVETPQVRAAARKPATATIWLRAARHADQVVVSAEDDGAGIDIARVRQIALERGMATAEALAGLDDAGVAELIFAPGFSTAPDVTGLSGRGVGMDAVRAAVERMGGRVRVDSRPGEGARVTMILPISVMVTQVMTVEACGQVFGIPLDALVEAVKINREQIKDIGAAQAFVLRGRTVPLINLARTLGLAGTGCQGQEATVVVAAIGAHPTGLEVDGLGERMDVILRPIGGLLAGMPGVAGATLLGDGRVLLVLDLQEILQ